MMSGGGGDGGDGGVLLRRHTNRCRLLSQWLFIVTLVRFIILPEVRAQH